MKRPASPRNREPRFEVSTIGCRETAWAVASAVDLGCRSNRQQGSPPAAGGFGGVWFKGVDLLKCYWSQQPGNVLPTRVAASVHCWRMQQGWHVAEASKAGFEEGTQRLSLGLEHCTAKQRPRLQFYLPQSTTNGTTKPRHWENLQQAHVFLASAIFQLQLVRCFLLLNETSAAFKDRSPS